MGISIPFRYNPPAKQSKSFMDKKFLLDIENAGPQLEGYGTAQPGLALLGAHRAIQIFAIKVHYSTATLRHIVNTAAIGTKKLLFL